MTESCQGGVTLPFLEGTTPGRYCELHGGSAPHSSNLSVTTTRFTDIDSTVLDDIPRPVLDWDLFPELQQTPAPRTNQNNRTQSRNNPTTRTPSVNTTPFLNDDVPVNIPPVNNPPAGESSSNNRNESAVIPDTAVQFIPRPEDSDEIDEDDDYLPPWNQLD